MSNNIVRIPVRANSPGSIACESHAWYHQQVTLRWASQAGVQQEVVFKGQGEGRPMVTGTGQRIHELAAESSDYEIEASFEYSRASSSSGFVPSQVKSPTVKTQGGKTTIQVGSEDANDRDYNDSILTVSYRANGSGN